MTPQVLLGSGMDLATRFCHQNNLPLPSLAKREKSSWPFGRTCAYWRPNTITICLPLCAKPASAGRQWSWPGYDIDRTPHGVVCHEVGHMVDWSMSTRRQSYY